MLASIDSSLVTNVLHKCISKMLCTRLKKAITHLVVDNQKSFVAGRSLVHNVLICYELLRHYNRETSPRCMMKIDLRKANGIVSWDFIEEALEGYGFPSSFTQTVMTYITSTRFSVKVNGIGYGYFAGKRGLRQGDPIYPLLSILVMEYLSSVFRKMLSFRISNCISCVKY